MSKTHVALILDKSGSMTSRRQQAITDWNQQINAMKESVKADPNLDIFVTGIIFDNGVDVLFEKMPLEQVSDLSAEQYVPSGGTALFDAIAKGIDAIQPEIVNPTDAALVSVITDGEENSSTPDSRTYVPKKIKELQGTNAWTFTYLGTNENLAEFTEKLGAFAGNVRSGIQDLGTQVTSSMNTRYFEARSRGATSMANAYLTEDTSAPKLIDPQGQVIKPEEKN